MGDATRKLADGFHFLGLAELFLKLTPLGYILRRADDAHHFASRAANRKAAVVNPPDGAVRPLNTECLVVSTGLPHDLGSAHDLRTVVGVNRIQPTARRICRGWRRCVPKFFRKRG